MPGDIYSSGMETVGTVLVIIGAALAVLQAVWILSSTGRRRSRLIRERERSRAREKRTEEVQGELRARWGDMAAEAGNYEELDEYRSDPDLDQLRATLAGLMSQRVNDDWVRTLASHDREPAVKERELAEVESEWRRLWTHGVVGLVGGVLAFVGGILTALGGC